MSFELTPSGVALAQVVAYSRAQGENKPGENWGKFTVALAWPLDVCLSRVVNKVNICRALSGPKKKTNKTEGPHTKLCLKRTLFTYIRITYIHPTAAAPIFISSEKFNLHS